MDNKEIGGFIRKLREEKFPNRARFAKKLGLTSEQVKTIENGEINFIYKRMREIADLLDTSVETICSCGLDNNLLREDPQPDWGKTLARDYEARIEELNRRHQEELEEKDKIIRERDKTIEVLNYYINHHQEESPEND